MPKSKSRTSLFASPEAHRRRPSHVLPPTSGCLQPGCSDLAIDAAPVPLCGKHLRKVYEFAQDLVTEQWDGAMRDYVAGLHSKFTPPRAVRRRPGNVYFIRLGDRIKVGYSERPEARLRSLPHEEVIGVVPGTFQDEHAWHQLLADYRVTGEWFRADPEVVAHIRRVCAAVETG